MHVAHHFASASLLVNTYYLRNQAPGHQTALRHKRGPTAACMAVALLEGFLVTVSSFALDDWLGRVCRLPNVTE